MNGGSVVRIGHKQKFFSSNQCCSRRALHHHCEGMPVWLPGCSLTPQYGVPPLRLSTRSPHRLCEVTKVRISWSVGLSDWVMAQQGLGTAGECWCHRSFTFTVSINTAARGAFVTGCCFSRVLTFCRLLTVNIFSQSSLCVAALRLHARGKKGD